MKNLFYLLLTLSLFSCSGSKDSQTSSSNSESESVYLLDSSWKNAEGKTTKLEDLKGKNTVVTMIFTSCQTACPLLLADMKRIEKGLDESHKKDTQMVLISIDPTNDTPEVLKKYENTNGLDGEKWTLLVSDEENIRNFANVLAVKYKKISPIEFSHSNIITVLDKDGVIVEQVEGTVNHNKIINAVNQL